MSFFHDLTIGLPSSTWSTEQCKQHWDGCISNRLLAWSPRCHHVLRNLLFPQTLPDSFSLWIIIPAAPRAWWIPARELEPPLGDLSSLCPCSCCLVTQSCLTLFNPVDCSLPGSSIHGILQARMLEWVAVSCSRGSSPPRGWTPRLLCLLHWQWVLYYWEAPTFI